MMTRKPSETRAVLNKHADWADPHLLAGRGRAGLIVAGLLIGAGALTDTLAFKNTLELALPQAPATQIWLMAAGVTSMALIAAAGLGIFLAIHRRDARNDSKLAAAMTAVTWIGLGLAMFLVWWPGYGARTSSGTVGILTAGTNFAPLVALFFAAIYFISGACTVFEAERLYNPEYVATADWRSSTASRRREWLKPRPL